MSDVCKYEITESSPNIIGSIGIYGESTHDIDILLHDHPSSECINEFLHKLADKFRCVRIDIFYPPSEQQIQELIDYLIDSGDYDDINNLDVNDLLFIDTMRKDINGDILSRDIGYIRKSLMSKKNQIKLINRKLQNNFFENFGKEEYMYNREELLKKKCKLCYDYCSELSSNVYDFLSCMYDCGHFTKEEISKYVPNWEKEFW